MNAEEAAAEHFCVYDWSELERRVATWRADGNRIVFTNGCFDVLHAGHLWMLNHAADLGDVLLVAINTDASVARLKGEERPIITEVDRAATVAAVRGVDAVTLFDQDTPLELIERLQPDVLVKGGDYRPEQIPGREVVEARGGSLVLVPRLPDRSTTQIISRMGGIAGRP